MNYYYSYSTPVGQLEIQADENAVTRIAYSSYPNQAIYKETPLIKKAFQQIEEYFARKRTAFDLPLNPKGTPFQKKVWTVLTTIPYGETWSYKQVAEAAGNPKACRAVGMANNRNPISIIVPCHRVIGANGKLVGYGGGLPAKEYLLNLEKEKK
ncbi:methylated-DNA--[protein]-cysteine S-methyltransferase [Parabacteroides chinchillae]|uniref:Methylated-DNA--protein-cysteine methyltransferase n=1 Tax=Parabacteroides chinchillae TaxID=871327 RepID=A0A8G2F386_9BACT|nr:methylated-DNA--[protein]-cysteine S-methyltransferase [Parabacteroides chinchillae]SEG02868.1 methylated-DNA-[protein]-cysteine S-methyltransferase [Parabacteroides chinchillae]